MKKEFEIKIKGKSAQVFYGVPVFGYLDCGEEYDVVVFNKKMMSNRAKEVAKKVREIVDEYANSLEPKKGE